MFYDFSHFVTPGTCMVLCWNPQQTQQATQRFQTMIAHNAIAHSAAMSAACHLEFSLVPLLLIETTLERVTVQCVLTRFSPAKTLFTFRGNFDSATFETRFAYPYSRSRVEEATAVQLRGMAKGPAFLACRDQLSALQGLLCGCTGD